MIFDYILRSTYREKGCYKKSPVSFLEADIMNDKERKISYYVPQLGKVTATLYNYAWKCYSLLDQKQDVKRMQDIDQLGVIRNVYGGTHHPRWEYVILQLSLISLFHKSMHSKGLLGWADNVDAISQDITGYDVLQTWTLLFNAGHLPGTFATERAILRCCKKNEDIKNAINDGLPNDLKSRGAFKRYVPVIASTPFTEFFRHSF